jgi:hypothetical protein
MHPARTKHADQDEVEEAIVLGWHGSGSTALEVKLLDSSARYWFPLDHVLFWLGFSGYPQPPDAQVQRQPTSNDSGGLPAAASCEAFAHPSVPRPWPVSPPDPSRPPRPGWRDLAVGVAGWLGKAGPSTRPAPPRPTGSSRPKKRARMALVKKERRSYSTPLAKQQVA